MLGGGNLRAWLGECARMCMRMRCHDPGKAREDPRINLLKREVLSFFFPSLSFLTIKDVFEMQKGSIQPGQTVLVIDDLIATGE